jgi:osmoprotectant transport system substrate-binding protein
VRRSTTVPRLVRRTVTALAAVTAVALTASACGGSADPLASSTAATSAAASAASAASSAASSAGSSAGSSGSASSSAAATGEPIVVGSANFPESALIADIYAAALTKEGIEASTKLNIGSREVYLPALDDGSINLIPEYSGVLLQYYDEAATAVSSEDVYTALQTAVPDTLQVLDQSAAEDKDAVVVTQDTASQYNLKSIADLAPVAGDLILGGPSEWETRPTGVPGLKDKYGVTFKEFRALDAGGPLTLNALTSDQIQAGNLFTTDPAITSNDLVVLEDPENLFAAQNILPLISKTAVTPEVQDALNGVSAKLTTDGVIDLLTKVTVDKEDSADVAKEWVDANL